MRNADLQNREQALAAEKCIKYRGTASVRIDAFHFQRKPDARNVQRLEALFRKNGCSRSEVRNHIPAIIDQHSLDEAIHSAGLTPDALRALQQENYCELSFPPGFLLECLHGLHRAHAATSLLPPGDQRWIVDFYPTGNISHDLKTALEEEYSCEKVPPDGEFFSKIRHYQKTANAVLERWWWARLSFVSVKKEQNLKRILHDIRYTSYRSAFDFQLDMPGLSGGMRLGTVHKMFAMRCDDEIICYLRYIQETWSRILGGKKEAMQQVDRATVQAVELTAPGACEQDAAVLSGKLRKGEIFGAFSEQERETIWREILAVSRDRLIPSLFSFFEDLNYMYGPAECIKRLVHLPKDESVGNALKRTFHDPDETHDSYSIQLSELEFAQRPGSAADRLDFGYRQTWISAWRNHEKIEDELLATVAMKASEQTLYVGALAHRLGFETRIEERDIARASEKPPKRCGIPRVQDHRRDQPLLFADKLHYGNGSGVTSFFVRRSVYLAFFGDPFPSKRDKEEQGQGQEQEQGYEQKQEHEQEQRAQRSIEPKIKRLTQLWEATGGQQSLPKATGSNTLERQKWRMPPSTLSTNERRITPVDLDVLSQFPQRIAPDGPLSAQAQRANSELREKEQDQRESEPERLQQEQSKEQEKSSREDRDLELRRSGSPCGAPATQDAAQKVEIRAPRAMERPQKELFSVVPPDGQSLLPRGLKRKSEEQVGIEQLAQEERGPEPKKPGREDTSAGQSLTPAADQRRVTQIDMYGLTRLASPELMAREKYSEAQPRDDEQRIAATPPVVDPTKACTQAGEVQATMIQMQLKTRTEEGNWIVKQGELATFKGPADVRRYVTKHTDSLDEVELRDSDDRILSIDTCVEDVTMDQSFTIFVVVQPRRRN
ncbi:hypothetical protein T440DRAFT_436373 [Plenodomus tracheiphilus IPT5]|uniref:Uncharacterized protein n=1 Tax=Plenodomus tracheiphilus IPT5 TaxID=1408161 RepID=A0A6A7AMU1_9PLEO|nr:hypothetical protein T440DRAFT_436373 [Plenodomus tracheiphilus IPT5]